MPFAYLIASTKLEVGEISQNFTEITGITITAIRNLTKNLGFTLFLDDIVDMINFENTVK
jgi:hypothetical protein